MVILLYVVIAFFILYILSKWLNPPWSYLIAILIIKVGDYLLKIILKQIGNLLWFKNIRAHIYRLLNKNLKAVEIETIETIDVIKRTSSQETFGDHIFTSSVKIEFVEDISNKEEHAERKEGSIILVLNSDIREKTKTFVKALWLYIQKEFIPSAYRFLDKELIFAMRYFVAIHVLRSKGKDYIDAFREYVAPVISESERIMIWLEKIQNIYENGFFFTVLYHELTKAMEPLEFQETDPQFKIEFQNYFIDFLYSIATKEKGEDVQLKFSHKRLRLGIVLVMKSELATIEPHIKRVRELLNDKFTAYLASSEFNKEEFYYIVKKLQKGYGITPFTDPVVFKSRKYNTKYFIACFESDS